MPGRNVGSSLSLGLEISYGSDFMGFVVGVAPMRRCMVQAGSSELRAAAVELVVSGPWQDFSLQRPYHGFLQGFSCRQEQHFALQSCLRNGLMSATFGKQVSSITKELILFHNASGSLCRD